MSVRAGVEGSNTGSSYAVAAADGRGAREDDGLSGGGGGGDGGGGSRVMMIEAAGRSVRRRSCPTSCGCSSACRGSTTNVARCSYAAGASAA